MRRGLVAASLGLTLAGLELSTEGVSLVLARLRTGASALVAGVGLPVGAPRFVLGVLALVAGVVLGGLTLWSARVWKRVAGVGGSCPRCGDRTRRVKRKLWHRLASSLVGERVTRRSCGECGWSGLSVSR